MPTDLTGKRATVMGLGRFGGGAGVTRWLVDRGADVLLTDLEKETDLAQPLEAIADLTRSGRVSLRLGEHNVSDFTDTDLVIANPAVPRPWDNRFLRAAQAASVPVTTEIRLLVERLPERRSIVAITGTVGKSTTSAMVHHALKSTGREVYFGGNIGGSLLADLPRISRESLVVLEVSSAMLYWLSSDVGFAGAAGWSPGIAVCTNIAANHIDWHGEFTHYQQSKLQLLRDQRETDAAVLNESLASWAATGPAARRTMLVREADGADIPPLSIPGRHNRMNAAVAVAAAQQMGIDRPAAARAIAQFPGLPHRLEHVGAFPLPAGGTFRAFNDSKCTTPEAAILALEAMDSDPALGSTRTRLICGGYDKKVDLSAMARAAARCAAVYTIGTTGPALAASIQAASGRARFTETLERAVAAALNDVRPGDVILLSPGCASWDQFTNYEERGADFARYIRAANH